MINTQLLGGCVGNHKKKIEYGKYTTIVFFGQVIR